LYCIHTKIRVSGKQHALTPPGADHIPADRSFPVNPHAWHACGEGRSTVGLSQPRTIISFQQQTTGCWQPVEVRPFPPRTGYTTQAKLKGPLAVTERADVSGCELFDYGLASELLLDHLACTAEEYWEFEAKTNAHFCARKNQMRDGWEGFQQRQE